MYMTEPRRLAALPEGGAAASREATSRAQRREPERQVRLLVIDDDRAILELLGEWLGMRGFAVKTTQSAEEFYEQLDAFLPDVVIVDLAMPSHDGLEILRAIKTRDFRGEIIIMSGSDGQVLGAARRLAAAQGLSIAGALHKPFAPEDLVALVAKNPGE